jgi:hypothetical protein
LLQHDIDGGYFCLFEFVSFESLSPRKFEDFVSLSFSYFSSMNSRIWRQLFPIFARFISGPSTDQTSEEPVSESVISFFARKFRDVIEADSLSAIVLRDPVRGFSEVRQRLYAAEKQLEESKTKCCEQAESIRSLEREKEEMKRLTSAKIASLEETKLQLETRLVNSEKKVGNCEAENGGLKKSVAGLDEKISALNATAVVESGKMKKLQSENDSLTQQVRLGEQKSLRIEEEKSRALAQIDHLEKSLRDLSMRHEEVEKANKTLREDLHGWEVSAAWLKLIRYREGQEFGGILSHLRTECGGNVHEKGIVSITSSGEVPCAKRCWQVTDPDWRSWWYTRNAPNSWIQFDFKERTIHLDHYTLKSDTDRWFPLMWNIEASRDGKTWVTLDTRNTRELASRGAVKTFECNSPSSEFFRYIRLRQTGKNGGGDDDLFLTAVDFFGAMS